MNFQIKSLLIVFALVLAGALLSVNTSGALADGHDGEIPYGPGGVPLCNGVPATIWGSGLITGTMFDDVIVGSNLPDEIHGLAGDDLICSYGANDRVYGEDGNDKVFAGYNDDRVWGGSGNDWLNGEQNFDRLNGGNGANTCLQGEVLVNC